MSRRVVLISLYFSLCASVTGCSGPSPALVRLADSDFGISKLGNFLDRLFPDNIDLPMPESWLEPLPVDSATDFALMEVPRLFADDAEQARYEARIFADSRWYPTQQNYSAEQGIMVASAGHVGRGVQIEEGGFRIAPTTRLGEEGMKIQKGKGCLVPCNN